MPSRGAIERTVVHTIELTHRRAAPADGPLARLTRDNHGTYRRVSFDDDLELLSRDRQGAVRPTAP